MNNLLSSLLFQGDVVSFPDYPNIKGSVTNITYEKNHQSTRPRRQGRRFFYTSGILYLRPKYHVRFLNVPASRFFSEDQLDFPAIDDGIQDLQAIAWNE